MRITPATPLKEAGRLFPALFREISASQDAKQSTLSAAPWRSQFHPLNSATKDTRPLANVRMEKSVFANTKNPASLPLMRTKKRDRYIYVDSKTGTGFRLIADQLAFSPPRYIV